MVRYLLVVIFFVQVAFATDDCPGNFGSGCSYGPAGGSNADQCDTNQCKQLDGGGFMYECFCSNCDNNTNTCTATTKTSTIATTTTSKATTTESTTASSAASTTASSTVSTTASTTASTSAASTSTTATTKTTANAATTASSCGTDDANCAVWVSNGFCTSTGYTAAQKRQYCPNYCGQCGATTIASTMASTTASKAATKTTATTATTATTKASCGTDDVNCATWVANGFCTSSGYTAAQRRQYCPNYCGQCGPTTTMATTKTTTVATTKTTTKAATKKTCPADASANCASWAASGFCTNSAYTQAQIASYCSSTCNIC
ncbi:unnamed protein product, partial [Mesorhabditis spiculigera]